LEDDLIAMPTKILLAVPLKNSRRTTQKAEMNHRDISKNDSDLKRLVKT